MSSITQSKRRTVSEGRDKVSPNTQPHRRSDSPLLNRGSAVRQSPRNQSPLASPTSTPPASQPQSSQSEGGSPSVNYFPDPFDSEEDKRESFAIDITNVYIYR